MEQDKALFMRAIESGDVDAIKSFWKKFDEDDKKTFLKNYHEHFLNGHLNLTLNPAFAEFLLIEIHRYLGKVPSARFVHSDHLPPDLRIPFLRILSNVAEKKSLMSIANEYKILKGEGKISRSGSVHQRTYDLVAPLKLRIYEIFKQVNEEKGRDAVQSLANWILEGNAFYKKFERNWKNDDERVVLISLLCHHTDSATWFVKNTTSYKIIEGIARTGDISALETDTEKKEEILERKSRPRPQ